MYHLSDLIRTFIFGKNYLTSSSCFFKFYACFLTVLRILSLLIWQFLLHISSSKFFSLFILFLLSSKSGRDCNSHSIKRSCWDKYLIAQVPTWNIYLDEQKLVNVIKIFSRWPASQMKVWLKLLSSFQYLFWCWLFSIVLNVSSIQTSPGLGQ